MPYNLISQTARPCFFLHSLSHHVVVLFGSRINCFQNIYTFIEQISISLPNGQHCAKHSFPNDVVLQTFLRLNELEIPGDI